MNDGFHGCGGRTLGIRCSPLFVLLVRIYLDANVPICAASTFPFCSERQNVCLYYFPSPLFLLFCIIGHQHDPTTRVNNYLLLYNYLVSLHQLLLLCLDSASKHALQSFFDSLRAEVAQHQIAVTVVSPGYIQTNLSLAAMNADGSFYGGNNFLISCILM